MYRPPNPPPTMQMRGRAELVAPAELNPSLVVVTALPMVDRSPRDPFPVSLPMFLEYIRANPPLLFPRRQETKPCTALQKGGFFVRSKRYNICTLSTSEIRGHRRAAAGEIRAATRQKKKKKQMPHTSQLLHFAQRSPGHPCRRLHLRLECSSQRELDLSAVTAEILLGFSGDRKSQACSALLRAIFAMQCT